ncbi:MAG: hydantoinase/oxoprolinase family protein [Gammaproteobacteria bacterium]|nr:hydantoinase/oxoprolinase family protein [Gammaproteobacteria bacterium]
MTSYRASADIGGTFTDLVVEPSDGPVFVGKVATTPGDPAKGVVEGLTQLVPDLSEVAFFVHGTTVGLNAFLERKGERVLLVTTAGHRDGYTIARGNRHSLYQLRYRKPELIVPRRDVHEVRGRLAWDGAVLEPLCEQDFNPIIDKAKAEGIRAVAVCLLHAYAFPDQELQAGELLQAALPEVSITLSHQVAREWREYERASSAVMNAYIAPVVQHYLASLEEHLRSRGLTAGVHVMQSSGGVISAAAARRNPVFTLLSGPVGGSMAGTALAERLGRKNLLCVDMGGTSFDLSLVLDGRANITQESELDGLPLLMPAVDIHTIGTGGGSIAWLDHGAVRVGPQSAGAVPGSACYGRGGVEPTVTDANLHLGRLGERSLLGGGMTLDASAAKRAIDRLARQVALTPTAFAEGILSISNAAMADAMRTITVSQGVDPRAFALVAFGGAGPMAAAFLAEELDIAEVLIPQFPGTLSAWGMLQTDLRLDFAKGFFHPAASVSQPALEALYAELEREGESAMLTEGVDGRRLSYQRSVDMRYVGQEYSITVPVAAAVALHSVIEDFHAAHQQRYGHSNTFAETEFVNLRVAVLGSLAHRGQSHRPTQRQDAALLGERRVVFNGAAHPTPVFARDALASSQRFEGPAIVEEKSATTVVPPGWRALVDPAGHLLLSK